MRMRAGSWLLLLLLCIAPPLRAEVRAWLDRDTVLLGETVTLNVEIDGVMAAAPELAPLAGNFHVGTTSSNAQMSVVNGRTLAKTLWAVVLEPRQEGVIGVPALTVGNERTSPLTLTVLPAPAGSSSAAGDDVFLEVEATPLDPYVQQQVRYTVRLFYAVQLLEGQLEEPQPDGGRLQRLGTDASYQRVIAGRRYQVVERQYLLSAERSGTLQVPPPRFRGRAIGPGMFGRGAGSILQASGDAVVLEVRPAPANAPRPWLPARELVLQDESGALPDRIEVGAPLTISLRLAAQGLFAEQLPELQLPPIDGAQVYPDRESSQTIEHSAGVTGERVRKFAVVPSRSGTLELPAIRIGWWNVQTGSAEVAELPARTIEVLPSSTAGSGAVAPALPAADDVAGDAAVAADPDVERELRRWQLATVLLSLALALLLGWTAYVRRAQRDTAAASTPSPALPEPRPSLAAALTAGDPARIAAALRADSPLPPGAGLDEVADHLDDPAQAAAVRELERARYAGGDLDAALDAVRSAFRGGARWRRAGAGTGATDGLPPLYR